MSMIGNFLELTPSELDGVIADPAAVESMLYPEEGECDGLIDIDNTWHAIHFILTGSQWEGAPPLANLILGGAEIGGDVGYGSARYLTATQVSEVAEAIKDIGPQQIAERFSRQHLLENEIYPDIWGSDEETDEELVAYIVGWYTVLHEYWLRAASKGNAMLKFLN